MRAVFEAGKSRRCMELFRWESRLHGTVVLTAERWNHIRGRHPGLKRLQERIRKAVENPDLIERSLSDPDTRVYYKRLDGQYIVVPVQVEDRFVKSAFLSRIRKGGEVVWKK